MLISDSAHPTENIVFANVNKMDLVDLNTVKVDTQKGVLDKTVDYVLKVNNPYLFRVGDVGVKVRFNATRDFTDILAAVIAKNYQIN